MNYKKRSKEDIINENDSLRQDVEILRAKYNKLKDAVKKENWAKTAILNNMAELLIYHSNDMKILWANKAAAESVGKLAEELVGKYCYQVWSQCDTPCGHCPIVKVLKTGEPQNGEITTADGRTWLIRGSPVRDAQGNLVGVLEITLNVSERKKAKEDLKAAYLKLKDTQEQLIQSSKMVAIGQLAAGISHELNQPLTGIKGFAQAAIIDIEENKNTDSSIKDDLLKIVREADRMDAIIKGVRFFARKSEFSIKEVDINKPVSDSLMLLEDQLRLNNIRLNRLLADDLPKLHGDANQLEQVFLNLITNAKDAIESVHRSDGGELKVKTCLSEDKKSIVIKVEDTGCGISRHDLTHIFNPFFTTKSPDGGMGLGLSIVYRIVEGHKGNIDVESEEGKGTSFTITLPVKRPAKALR
ncbi:MAG: ATP-binding protein [Candidatus Omnitrophota bacterium]